SGITALLKTCSVFHWWSSCCPCVVIWVHVGIEPSESLVTVLKMFSAWRSFEVPALVKQSPLLLQWALGSADSDCLLHRRFSFGAVFVPGVDHEFEVFQVAFGVKGQVASWSLERVGAQGSRDFGGVFAFGFGDAFGNHLNRGVGREHERTTWVF